MCSLGWEYTESTEPMYTNVIAYIKCSEDKLLEKAIHHFLAGYRYGNSEFFEDKEVLEFLENFRSS